VSPWSYRIVEYFVDTASQVFLQSIEELAAILGAVCGRLVEAGLLSLLNVINTVHKGSAVVSLSVYLAASLMEAEVFLALHVHLGQAFSQICRAPTVQRHFGASLGAKREA